MILRQFLHADPVGISYLFGCGGKAAGAVVDPAGDIQPYLRAAQDHLSAGRALAEAAGAEYVLSAEADVSFPFKGVRDDNVLSLGNVTATLLYPPGHIRFMLAKVPPTPPEATRIRSSNSGLTAAAA